MKIQEIIKEANHKPVKTNTDVGAATAFVNIFLNDEEKLPESATKEEVKDKIKTLPKAQQMLVLEREVESTEQRTAHWQREKNWMDLQMAHSNADQAGNSTRPKIALLMAYLVVFMGSAVAVTLFYAVMKGDEAVLTSLGGAWEIVTFALATPTLLLRSYFGLRTSEKRSRYAASVGQQLPKGFFESIAAGSKG